MIKINITSCPQSHLNINILRDLVNEADLQNHLKIVENVISLENANNLDHVALVVKNKKALLKLQEQFYSDGGEIKHPVHLWPNRKNCKQTVHWENRKYMLNAIVRGLLIVAVSPVGKYDVMWRFLGASDIKIHHFAILVDNFEYSVAQFQKCNSLKPLGKVAGKNEFLKQIFMTDINGNLVEIIWRKDRSGNQLDSDNIAFLSESLRVHAQLANVN
jgi:hypothetical protein